MGVCRILGDGGAVLKGATDQLAFYPAFAVQDVERGLDGGVRLLWLAGEAVEDLLDVAGTKLPEHTHEAPFEGSEDSFWLGHGVVSYTHRRIGCQGISVNYKYRRCHSGSRGQRLRSGPCDGLGAGGEQSGKRK